MISCQAYNTETPHFELKSVHTQRELLLLCRLHFESRRKMSSRREEERNEKIIRGLMKLPPNRRCINCNSMVPQYVCTNFWTFVCTTCSGIHREFTHRVKSVSMAKFTTQELEALQNGGNQRAREIYLKEWDAQNLRLPDNSKPDKIREFIKNVYVDKKFVGGKSSDKASKDMQQLSSQEDEIRRASSYHSYSQSPPYDFQYEERRYGKRTSALSRKPGSDRGLYDRKFSGFLSPSRLIDRNPNHPTDRVSEDRFGIERSNSRASDCSISSGGDPFKSDIQSPNFQKDGGSLSSETSREFSSEDLNYSRNSNVDLKRTYDGGRMSHSQRTASSPGSYGVPNNQLLSSKSNDFTGFVDIASESVQTFEAHSSSALTSQSSLPMNFDGLDLFNAPFAPQNISSTAPIIGTSSFPEFSSEPPMDLFQSTLATNFSSHQVAQVSPPSPALFSKASQRPPAAAFAEKSSDVLVPTNEGWATFDFPQHVNGAENSATMKFSCDKNSLGNFEQCTPSQWPCSQDVSSYGPSSAMHPVNRHNPPSIEAVPSIANTQNWNAFEDSSGQLQSSKEASEFQEYRNKSVPFASSTPLPYAPLHNSSMPLHDISGISVGGYSSFNHVSTNPFDLPYDPAEGYSDVSSLWDMSSLQAALPNGQMPTSFAAAANQTWFSDDQTGPFCPVDSEGVLEFISGQGSSKQLMNGPIQGPVASVGGNPFA